ncbi:MAG: Rpn family recombination-promoting nuclease/putative transposase, partial [Lachnospiraceae bacterium]|nr:Rpn family recombination-promoting nuclease/putative transposase [Lachnospiraceae bacterium]
MDDRKNAPGISMPHDKGYKKSLSDPRQFLHFLQKYIGADWMLELKDYQLSLCDKEMLEKDYEGREADLIYRVMRPDGREIYIFVLQELQSTVDYTMIFRILIYVVNTLLKHFLETDKKKRESVDFRLPAMVPIVFYNGEERWTAVDNMQTYQDGGEMFGDYILNLKYYLIDLASVEEEYILSTNTVIDNILYCDKFRRKQELVEVIRTAYSRVQKLGAQELEAFRGWVKYILLSVCDNKEEVVQEILDWAGNGESDMAFKYNMIVAFERERAEGREEGKEDGKAEGRA